MIKEKSPKILVEWFNSIFGIEPDEKKDLNIHLLKISVKNIFEHFALNEL
jgi:hypothetical protein